MFNKIVALLFVIIFSMSIFAQKAVSKSNEQITDVNFCDLLKNPSEYKDKNVRVKATYRFSFEQAELFCSDCGNKKRVWVDFTDNFIENSEKKFRKKLKAKDYVGKTVNVIFVGSFLSGKGYGHFGAYPFMFLAQRIDYAEVIQTNGSHILSNQVRAKTYCQKND